MRLGGADHWAIWATLIESCKLNGIGPHADFDLRFAMFALPRRLADTDQPLPWKYEA